MARERRLDLAVVGAGIIGSIVALEARERWPGWEIGLLDQGRVGQGATARSVGLAVPWAPAPSVVGLLMDAMEWYARQAAWLPEGAIRPQPLVVVVPGTDVERFQDRVVGDPLPPATPAEVDAVRRSYPDLRLGPDDVVLSTANRASVVAAGAVTEAVVERFQAAPASWVGEGWGVTGVVRDGSGWRLDGREPVHAARVVVATGPWLGLWPERAADAGIRVKRIVALEADDRPTPGGPGAYFVADDVFAVPGEQGSVVSFNRDVWDEDPRKIDDRVTDADLEAGRRAVSQRSPCLAELIVGGRAFCDAYAADRLPVLAAEHGGTFVAAGACAGSGVRLGPGMARRIVELIAS